MQKLQSWGHHSHFKICPNYSDRTTSRSRHQDPHPAEPTVAEPTTAVEPTTVVEPTTADEPTSGATSSHATTHHDMAFTGETPGEFWLGRLHRECGSARGKQFEVEWYDTTKDSKAWALEDDGLDIMRAARVLVERIHLQPTETEGHFALTEESEEEIMAAL